MVAERMDELEAGVTMLTFTRVASFLFVLYIVIQWRFLLVVPLSPLKVLKVTGLKGSWFGVLVGEQRWCVWLAELFVNRYFCT